MMEWIDNLIQLFGSDGDFQKQKFKDGVISAFIKTGAIPCNVDENGITILRSTMMNLFVE
jgi:hypothetical protein